VKRLVCDTKCDHIGLQLRRRAYGGVAENNRRRKIRLFCSQPILNETRRILRDKFVLEWPLQATAMSEPQLNQTSHGAASAISGDGGHSTTNTTNYFGQPPQPHPAGGVHLPQRKAQFVGRKDELATLEQQLKLSGSLATICGGPGRGKTSIALEFATRTLSTRSIGSLVTSAASHRLPANSPSKSVSSLRGTSTHWFAS
jgi:hypothetical protein